jgi:dethiobiotin synthetase
MKKIFFITGTDTGVGKTTVASLLLENAKAQGLKCFGLKPVASGACQINKQWVNEDALKLHQAASVKLTYEEINPFIFKEPIAPHLAAKHEGKEINVKTIIDKIKSLLDLDVDYILIEGAGGLMVPLNDTETFADLIKELDIPIILVAAMRLGVLNHACLTAIAIEKLGLKFEGWIANCLQPDFQYLQENIETLEKLIAAPNLEIFPYKNT